MTERSSVVCLLPSLRSAGLMGPGCFRYRAARCPGGGERNRTVDLLLAKQALSQLSYTPLCRGQKATRQRSVQPVADSRLPAAIGQWPFRAGGPGRLVGRGGFEPPTSRLSSARSNQLSYQPRSRRYGRDSRTARPDAQKASGRVSKANRFPHSLP